MRLAAPAGSAARAAHAPGASRAIPAPIDWQHLPALDGLRAAAVVAVLLFHAGHLQGGFLGVDLFFALSGFLITSLLLRDAEHGGVRLLAFWGRRFRRLLPAAFVLIAIVALGAWVLGSPAELDGVRRTGGWALGYMANWHFITEADGYWVSFDQPSMFDHLWSLAIEEQFYVVWPLVVAAVWKLSRARYRQRNLLAVCVGGVAASFVVMLVLQHPGSDPTRVYMGTDTRAASILVGAALATAPARRAATSAIVALGRRGDRVIALLAVGIGASWVVVDGANSDVLYRGGLLLHSAASAALVTALASASGGGVAAALSWRPLVWVGVRSYGLYLWHWPVYVTLSSERTGLEGPTLTVVRIAVSAVLAAASFRLVEDPIRHRATWVRDRRGLPALAGAVTLVAATLIVLPRPRSEIAAFDPGSITAPRTADRVVQPPPVASPATRAAPSTRAPTRPPSTTPPSTTPQATTPPSTTPQATTPPSTTPQATTASTSPTSTSNSTTTTITPPAAPPPADALTSVARGPIRNVMWTGDSIAYDLAPAVGAALAGAGVLADSSAYLGMRLIDDGQFALLPRLREALPVTEVDVLVVQLSIWDADHDAATQRAALDDLHALVVGHGGRLVLISPPPTVDTAKDGRLSTMTDHARAIAAADPASTTFLDAGAVWGPVFDDDLDDDGTPERKRDGVHVCPSGAARFALWLTAELAARFGGVAPTPPTEWAVGTWVTDARYDEPIGSCAPLS